MEQAEKKETQAEKLLKMLRKGSVTTKEIVDNWIMSPTKVVESLRLKGYVILTEPIKGKKHCKYTLIPTAEQGRLF